MGACISCSKANYSGPHRLVQDLGLKTTLSEHAVPRTDLRDIATRVLGTTDDPIFERVVNLLEKIY